MNRFSSPVIIALALAAAARADVKLPAVFSDNMVLQRGEPVAVWGTAAAGEEVKVEFAGQISKTKASEKGKWKAVLSSMKASDKPADLMVTGKNKITIKNVLVGEVWVCSGQSNMQWTVAQAGNSQQEIAAAKLPAIRMFNIERETAMEPQDDCKGQWLAASPEAAASFSAAGYFFGRELHKRLNVPVGLINTSWGGTRVEAWTSREALEQRPCAKDMLADWQKQLASFDPAKAAADDQKRRADWQAAVKRIEEENQKLPAGQPKKTPPPAPRGTDNPTTTPHRPSAIYNRMIASIIPYGIKGAIWYQGESNQRRAFQYQELLPAMINDWRQRWNDEFSFYIVQLANFGNGRPVTKDAGVADAWAELQEAQLLTAMTMPKCGLAVANDIGEERDIHPKNKQEVGRRLALWALAKDYGKKDIVFSGPVLKGSKTEDGKVRVQFHFANGLKTRDGKEPAHFQIAGPDGQWQWAKAKIEGKDVVVWHDAVKQPAGVRYAWAAMPEGANLVNGAGLPASLFRTDDLPLSTLGVTSPFAENPQPAAAPAPAVKPAPVPAADAKADRKKRKLEKTGAAKKG